MRNANFCKPLPEKVPLHSFRPWEGGMTEGGGRKSSLPPILLLLPLLARRLLISARAIESNVKKVVRNETGEEERRKRLLPIWRRTRRRRRMKTGQKFLLCSFSSFPPPVSHIAISNLFPSSPNTAATLTSV